MRMVNAAKEAGADIIKFQTFKTEDGISCFAPKAEYQRKQTGSAESQFAMVKKLELSFDDFIRIESRCREAGIVFLSTPFDLGSIDFLETLHPPFWKIPSGEITNLPYLRKIGRTGRPVVLSTGMSVPEEIQAALDVLISCGTPSLDDITLLHCNTQYPTPFGDVNLRAMQTLRERFGVKVGYSDHTQGVEIAVAAAALGATVIEKHFTLDRTMTGPDHQASLEPHELSQMVSMIRHVEAALGDGQKKVSPSERGNVAIARKSIVAARNIAAGELLSDENLAVKRPGNGISPMRWDEIIGSRAKRAFEKDELIE